MSESLEELFGANLQAKLIYQYTFALNNRDRLETLLKIVDRAYDDLIENRHLVQKEGEDELTSRIISFLKGAGLEASHDTQIGGHTDILVKAKGGFQWLAEAKRHKDYSWIQDGFLQLCTRYSVSQDGRDTGELIIYCFGKNARKVLSEWNLRASENLSKYLENVEIEEIQDGKLYFLSSHDCPSSGLKYNVRHRVVPLYFEPIK